MYVNGRRPLKVAFLFRANALAFNWIDGFGHDSTVGPFALHLTDQNKNPSAFAGG